MTPIPGSATRPDTGARTLRGTPVVPGVGYGPAVRPAPPVALPTGPTRPPEPGPGATPGGTTQDGTTPDGTTPDGATEAARFTAAAERVAVRLGERAERASGAAAEVLVATAGLARDRGLRAAVTRRISHGADAAWATVEAAEEFEGIFRSVGGLMAERVTDLRDVRDRIVADLTGVPEPGIPRPEEPSVLLADDLAPADTAGLDPSRILALATRLGGPTSHTAIIARQLGLPCVVAVEGLQDVAAGTPVLVDGGSGEVAARPDPVAAGARVLRSRREREAVAGWRGPGATADGHRVEILANVQDGAGARAAAGSPAEGVGLFRTELCFLDRAAEPSVEEQAQVYAEVFAAFGDRKVVVRTLDAGSDKPLAFVTVPDEPNPALGVRGLRIAQGDPGILDRQLEAIARAARLAGRPEGDPPRVMAPMVGTEREAAFFAGHARGYGLVPGVMVEIPAAALHAERLLRQVEFLSIGTNDLAQYTMAADRLSPGLAALTDPWQPALLQLVSITARAGLASGKPVGVCGEAAADPLLGCVLTGLGVTSLSAAAAAVAAVGSRLATVSVGACREAAEAALGAATPEAAREAARGVLGEG